MNGFPIETVLAVIGIAVSGAAFVREFVLVGRKKLGYRVQMDVPITEMTSAATAGALENLLANGEGGSWDRTKLSVVLVRIENSGSLAIEADDYTLSDPARPKVGAHLNFEDREVIGCAIAETEGVPLDNFGEDSGMGRRNRVSPNFGIVDLPKIALNRRQHYKVLAVLHRTAGTGEPAEPELVCTLRNGQIEKTTSNDRPSAKLLALTSFLAVVVVAQGVLAINTRTAPPVDCASGSLRVVGSTAIAPAIGKAADLYAATCTEAAFHREFTGTEDGLIAVTRSADPGSILAFGDGLKGESYPELREQPIAVSSFSMITHPGTGVSDLTVAQVRALFRGTVTNWKELGGNDVPVVLVDRVAGSGTRRALESRLLEQNRRIFPYVSCVGMARGGPQCEVKTTEEMVDAVARLAGAVGYAETYAVRPQGGSEVRRLALDGVTPGPEAVRAGRYPFWGVENLYTRGAPPGESLAARFADYVVVGKAKTVLQEFGLVTCQELSDPSSCRPPG
ncbi:substrate-binding domain-containing protein [Nocardia thailandica]|uniref:substrate-binding domain-containing protein n=1 Tax=Nocardia thailandica TaxID=257275 RepID=UPI0002E727E6|nr:substrate-binding domain-containing protein [Nocardia thailandica]